MKALWLLTLLPTILYAADYTYTVSWTPVTQDVNNNTIAVDSYRVETGPCQAGSPKVSWVVAGPPASVTISKASYCWTVYATGNLQESAPSQTVTFHGTADTDGDGVLDFADNCTLVHNAAQIDADDDGYGNACDGDLDNNGFTNAQDAILFRLELGKVGPLNVYSPADINSNEVVNAQDYVLFRKLLGSPPGPSETAQ